MSDVAGDPVIPRAVFGIWWAALVLTLVVLVPLAVVLLHRTWRAARSIQGYAAEALAATTGVAAGTRNIVALDTTIAVAGEMVELSSGIAAKLDTTATVLAQRAD